MDTIAVVVADEQWLAQLTECCNASWHAAKQHDGALFSQPPPIDECPICMLPLKMNRLERAYYPCCGKEICIGCVYALGHNRRKCVFCRTPMNTSNRELIKQFESRVEAGDALATFCLGCLYDGGRRGLRRDRDKAVKLWLRAAVLGNAGASSMIGYACCYGSGVEVDHEKALGCWKLAAIRGDAGSRYILGTNEVCLRNYDRALNHFVISAVAGHDESLTAIQMFYMLGYAPKDVFEKALRAHYKAKKETESDQRETATALLWGGAAPVDTPALPRLRMLRLHTYTAGNDSSTETTEKAEAEITGV
jgi:TPR repeat protein